ncbi:acyltransferase [Pelagicoccus mobilis]|uniref:Acyltransferase n=1 Tax=Pelagicoccus mobilis TaxID=415221 RepID=A0A934RWR9_9BACT|nr:acyltransferase [Pelagicoccus mobilis]MBK1876629.1 acyltransferase [Pelagicoccus mobilis]
MGGQFISLKKDSFIGSDSWIAAIPGKTGKTIHRGTTINIGENVCISGHCTITAASDVTIEDQVLIARYVYISDHSHEYKLESIPIKNQGITKPSPVRIGSGSWIGQSSVICPGVTIGRNCVIAANSVVKSNIPDYHIAAGSPARVVKKIKTDEINHE